MPSFRESVLEQYGRDYACLECVLEFPAEYKAVAHFSYLHAAVEEEGRLPVRFGFLSYCHFCHFYIYPFPDITLRKKERLKGTMISRMR